MVRQVLGQFKVHVTDYMALPVELTAERTIHTRILMLKCQRHEILHSGHVDIGSQFAVNSRLTVSQEHDELLQFIVITDFVPSVHRLQVGFGKAGCYQHY